MRTKHIPMLSGIVAALTLFFSWHIFATTTYNVPENPISVASAPVVEAYMLPFFTQSWNFFAPMPMERDLDALYRIRYRDRSGREVTSGWISLVETLNHHVRYNPLAPKMVVRSTVFSSIVDASNKKFFYGALHSQKGRSELADPARQPYEIVALERTAMGFVPQQLAPGTRYHIQLAALIRVYPRFTHRFEDPKPEQMPSLYAIFPWVTGQWVVPIL